MPGSFSVVEDKIDEAQFFLEKLCGSSLFEAKFYFSAFVSSTRSITFALQSCMAGIKGFEDWYREAQNHLRNDKLAPLFKELRNENIHKGINPINCVPIEVVRDYLHNQFSRNLRFNNFIVVKIDSDTYNKIGISSASEEYLKSLVTLVYECYSVFRNTIDPRWYYTKENFQRMGKTIEDALGELGFPRTWFGEMSICNEAWVSLRRNQPLCPLNPLFYRYLGKVITDPDHVVQ
jgi:hypothetical protein